MADIVSLRPFSVLSAIFRVTGIAAVPLANGYEMTAQLHHARASLAVTWQARQPDVRLKPGVLVSPRWKSTLAALDQPVAIHRLVYLDRPERSENLFRTVPAKGAFEAALFERAGALWECLPLGFQELFNTLFWDGQRFLRYCTGPSSMIGHHARACGIASRWPRPCCACCPCTRRRTRPSRCSPPWCTMPARPMSINRVVTAAGISPIAVA